MKKLEKNGFFVINKLIDVELASRKAVFIKSFLEEAAKSLNYSYADYINSTGRWGSLSHITKSMSDIDLIIKPILENVLGLKITSKKSNIICKTKEFTDSVPFHQDISYSYNDPYHFSVWLSLNDVNQNSGALKVAKYSHQLPIRSAIDFWSPDFENIEKEFDNIESISVSCADAIVFDSRLWHGSDENIAKTDRFAYVTRWSIIGKEFPDIPKPNPAKFGMFNCGNLTRQILLEGLSFLKYDLYNKDLHNIIEYYYFNIDAISLVFQFDKFVAAKDLHYLLILHKASELHDAGDASGKIYKNLWFSMLKFINLKTKTILT